MKTDKALLIAVIIGSVVGSVHYAAHYYMYSVPVVGSLVVGLVIFFTFVGIKTNWLLKYDKRW